MYFPTPEYEKAVDDCTEALRINPKHERSVGRRGSALEKLGRFEEAVRGRLHCHFACTRVLRTCSIIDYMAATILTGFQDQKLSESVDRVLKIVCEAEAHRILEVCEFLTIACPGC